MTKLRAKQATTTLVIGLVALTIILALLAMFSVIQQQTERLQKWEGSSVIIQGPQGEPGPACPEGSVLTRAFVDTRAEQSESATLKQVFLCVVSIE